MDKKKMSFGDWAEYLWDNGLYEDIIQEMHWGDGFSAKLMLEHTNARARERGVIITGAVDLDSEKEKVFWRMWQASERGLS